MADGVDPRTGSAEGESPERPSPAEAGKPGTPGAADHATGADQRTADVQPDERRGPGHEDHAAGGHDEHNDHAEARLGPIDWPAWAASALGVAVAAVMAALFLLAVVPR